MTNRERAFLVTTKKQNVLSIGIGDEEIVWMISELAYNMHAVCDNDYAKIHRLKQKGFKSNKTQTFYNCSYKDLPEGTKFNAVNFNIKGLEAFKEVAPHIRNFMVPEGLFCIDYDSEMEDSNLKKICMDNNLDIKWLRFEHTLAPLISYKAPSKSKWISVKKK